MGKALALMYHDVVPADCFSQSGFNTVGADHYKLTQEQFEAHLNAIAAVIKGKPARITDDGWQASFLFTMDDGGSSSLYVADQLERRGWRGHFFITTDYIGTRGFLNDAELRELAGRGHCVGSHTCSHPMPMWDCTPEQMYAEWRASRQKLEGIIGQAVTCGSVPGGAYSPPIAEAAAKAGYHTLFNSEPTSTLHHVDGCSVVGRFGIFRTTPATEAAKLAVGDLFACSKQQALWNAKKVLKKVAAKPYAAARSILMNRRYSEAGDADAAGSNSKAQLLVEPEAAGISAEQLATKDSRPPQLHRREKN